MDAHGRLDVTQAVLTEVDRRVGELGGDDRGDEDLPTVAGAQDSGRGVERRAEVVPAAGLGLAGVPGFIAGTLIVAGGWLVWVAMIFVIGTIALPEPATRSSMPELLRTLGFATAPGVLLAFAAIRPAALIVAVTVSLWMIADAVLAMRQALDYRSSARAIAVCVTAWLLSIAMLAVGLAFLFWARRRNAPKMGGWLYPEPVAAKGRK